MREVLRRLGVLVALPFQADPWRALAVFLFMGLGPAGEVFNGYWLKMLTDGFVEGDRRRIELAALLTGITSGFLMVSVWTGVSFLVTLIENTSRHLDLTLMRLTSSIPGLEAHERPEYLDRIELLRVQRGGLASALQAFVSVFSMVVMLAATGALLVRVSPWLLLLPLFAAPSVITSAAAETIRQSATDRASPVLRKARHLVETATTVGPAKEMRIFGLGEEMAHLYDDTRAEADRIINRANAKAAALSTLGWLAFAAAYALALFIVLRRAVAGEATPGDVVLTLSLVGRINQTVVSLIGVFGWLLSLLKVVERFRWLREFATRSRDALAGRTPAPERLVQGITLEHVSFAYPGTEVTILDGIDLDIPAGAVVALVGDNGAGKSTIVKLLSRMYEPTSGRITVDGVNLADIDPEQWRSRLAAGFQDFARLELLAGETVGVGDLPRIADVTAVEGALERAAASEVLLTLEHGLESQLGTSFDGGVELSGGQWQKLALGRAMMRTAPLLLILDEPTASLDAPTEHALFERYTGAATRVGHATGAITVLVSHRFSTVRMAELVIVIDGGKVVEVGSHHELMAADGLYAELYELQARGYR